MRPVPCVGQPPTPLSWVARPAMGSGVLAPRTVRQGDTRKPAACADGSVASPRCPQGKAGGPEENPAQGLASEQRLKAEQGPRDEGCVQGWQRPLPTQFPKPHRSSPGRPPAAAPLVSGHAVPGPPTGLSPATPVPGLRPAFGVSGAPSSPCHLVLPRGTGSVTATVCLSGSPGTCATGQ